MKIVIRDEEAIWAVPNEPLRLAPSRYKENLAFCKRQDELRRRGRMEQLGVKAPLPALLERPDGFFSPSGIVGQGGK